METQFPCESTMTLWLLPRSAVSAPPAPGGKRDAVMSGVSLFERSTPSSSIVFFTKVAPSFPYSSESQRSVGILKLSGSLMTQRVSSETRPKARIMISSASGDSL